jgi:hypothetical protein
MNTAASSRPLNESAASCRAAIHPSVRFSSLVAKLLPIAWLVLSLLYIPFSVGVADSLASSGAGKGISEIETDRGVLSGRVVRVTSAYILLAREAAIITVPLSKVREVRRLYRTSPEADFDGGPEAPDG